MTLIIDPIAACATNSAVPGTVIGWDFLDSLAVPQPIGITNVISLSCSAHALALRSDGTVVGWGREAWIPQGLSNVVAVAAGDYHSLALRADGTVFQWGDSVMPPVPKDLKEVRAIAAGHYFSLALRTNGTVVGWGLPLTGGTNIPSTLTNAIAIAAGDGFGVALTENGRLVRWSEGGSSVDFTATNIVAIDAGWSFVQVLKTDGTIVASGVGIPGDNSPPPGLSNVVAMGIFRALKRDGSIATWGPSNQSYPPPAGLSNVVGIASGAGLNCAIVLIDDTHVPSVSARDARAWEGDINHDLALTVVLSVPFPRDISVGYETIDGTAFAKKDYSPTKGRISFPANTTTQTFMVTIKGNPVAEPDKTFYIRFFEPSNSVVFTERIAVTLLNDDKLVIPSGFGASAIDVDLMYPTRLAFSPDGRLFVCEQEGRIQVFHEGRRLAVPFLQIPVTTEDLAEAGFLGLAFDPGFRSNQYYYVYYTVSGTGAAGGYSAHNRISRFTASGNTTDTNTETIVLEIPHDGSSQIHNGGALHFGGDGRLYVGVGDHGVGSNAQMLTNLLGKILRINTDGSIPSDNPFFAAATNLNRAIWAIGLRNPFSFAFNEGTGRMLINDVGLDTWEEIDEGIAGANYGWPAAEGFAANCNCRNPVFSYPHGSARSNGCAIVGATFYPALSNNFPPEFEGNYFFADYCNGWIRRLGISNLPEDFITGAGNIVDLKVGPDGVLYALSLPSTYRRLGGGKLYRFSWKDPVSIQSVTTQPGLNTTVRAEGRPGHRYVLEASSDLVNWTDVASVVTIGETLELHESSDAPLQQRFYRIRE